MGQEILHEYDEMIHRINYHLISNSGKDAMVKKSPNRKIILALKYHKKRLVNKKTMFKRLPLKEKKHLWDKYYQFAKKTRSTIDGYIDVLGQVENNLKAT